MRAALIFAVFAPCDKFFPGIADHFELAFRYNALSHGVDTAVEIKKFYNLFWFCLRVNHNPHLVTIVRAAWGWVGIVEPEQAMLIGLIQQSPGSCPRQKLLPGFISELPRYFGSAIRTKLTQAGTPGANG